MRVGLRYTPFLLVFLLAFFSLNSFAQEQIGGPYTVDDNTVLLLHFDGDLTNPSTMSDDAVGHGNYSFFPRPNFGQCLRFDNDALSDSSYATVPDNDNLDMVGSWTIEGWINVFTFGQSSSDHRWVPRLVIKPGDEAFWQPNYWVELWGDNRWFQVGFHDSTQSYWPAVTSAPNVMAPGEWVHLTFIRDDERKILVQMVHDEELNLKWFGTMSYADLSNTVPINTNQDVHIGWAGAVGIPTSSVDSWLDGFVDEIRISNIVRDFAVPPVITSLSQVPNQEVSATEYTVSANLFAFSQTGSISSAVLHYTADDGTTWTDLPMTQGAGDEYAAVIPQQPTGTVVKYYVTATDDRDQTSQYPEEGNDPLSFGVYQPESQILELTFEEGSGDPIDHSSYSQYVDYYAGPFYTDDAAVGNYAYQFPEEEDSAYLSIDSPFLTAEEFALDFWVKFEGDTILPYIRFVIRSASGNHVDQNYYVRTEPGNTISARYQVDPDLESRTRNDVNLVFPEGLLEIGKWLHIQYERSSDLVVAKVFDEEGSLLGKQYDVEDIALNPPRPGKTPLRIGWAGNSWEGTVRKLNGKMDDIKIYNYAALEMDTTGTVVGVKDVDGASLPTEFALDQNYPNPFNPSTKIKFQIPAASRVNLTIFNLLGQEVATIVNEDLNAGTFEVEWNGKNNFGGLVSSGVYFYKLKADDYSQIRKMILMK